ncbi:hypothetical protein ACFYO9_21535 [Streptomyces sp. NPDC005863]|uniref:hypothetical protein n=1 Tax=unclassified Streptomyces TaxID=2593676 RepID=UPI0033D248D3
MTSLLAQIAVILLVFLGLLTVLGSGLGTLELSLWAAAQVALIVYAVRRYRRAVRASGA